MRNRCIAYLSAIVAAVSVFMLSENSLWAQSRFGVIGGMTFSNAERQSLNRSSMNKFHAGFTYQLKLPFGLSIQPSLMYHVKGAKLKDVISTDFPNTCDVMVGYLELPVSLQWGPDLLLFRPFLDVTPFVGYGLNNRMDLYVADHSGSPGLDNTYRNSWIMSDMNRWEYGLGIGVGLEIWKFQVIGRYNWNFGSLYGRTESEHPFSDIKLDIMKEAFSKGNNFGEFTLSISFMF